MQSDYSEITANNRDFVAIRDKVVGMVGERDSLRDKLKAKKADVKRLSKRYDAAIKARKFIQEVAQQVQAELEYHISSLVTLADSAIFDDPYMFQVEFVQRRNKTEADLWFVKDGERMEPISSSGGGALDVASFALRCSFCSLSDSRAVVILDEPFKFLSRDLQEKASEMVKMVSDKLSLQFIMISHIQEQIGCADKVFEVVQVGGISEVSVVC